MIIVGYLWKVYFKTKKKKKEKKTQNLTHKNVN